LRSDATPIAADPIFAAIDEHREAYTAMEKAEDDYNADPEEKEEGPIADRLHEAVDRERQVFDVMVSTKPRTDDEALALTAYVDEVAKRQEEKGHWDGGREMLAANLREVAALRGVSVT
jgi:hypothetical protein